MVVSKNDGTPKSSMFIRISIINHPFGGTIIFGNIHIPNRPVLPESWGSVENDLYFWKDQIGVSPPIFHEKTMMMGGRVPPNSTSFLIILFQNGWFYQLPNQKHRKNRWFLLCIQLFSRARQPQNMHKIHTVHSGFSDIAMGNLPFEDVSPIKNGGFPLLC